MFLTHAAPAAAVPGPTPLQKRNTLADWAFYDVGGLTEPEFDMLAKQPARKGSILVVEPVGDARSIRVRKHVDHTRMLAHPGATVERFAVAGVGSSDVGAAALARTLANHLDAPVGAIVAGYGLANIVQEALGGWFFFGAANRAQARLDRLREAMWAAARRETLSAETAMAGEVANDVNAAATLLRLLQDDSRAIKTLLGHSKGCLSIAFAFNAIRNVGGAEAVAAYADIDVVTAGAVVDLPKELTQVRQYLGAIDWFGGLNSIPGEPRVSVPAAWHHLNTELPMHMDLGEVLRGRYDPA